MENSEQMEYQPADPSDYAYSGHVSATYDGSGDANAHGQSPNVGQVSKVDASYEAKPDNFGTEPTENLVIDHTATDTSQSIGYGSLNGSAGEAASYHSSEAVENGSIPTDKGGNIAEQTYENVAVSAEEERLWNMVRTNSLDFNAWIALIEETERNAENNIIKIRRVYDAFLPEFPLCYGYWKKYADHEGRLATADKVVEVYERAVLAVTYSVEIWLHYCVFAISTYEDPDTIRRLFERGLAYVGTDYNSFQLWDEYIRYEESLQAWSHVAMIYTRILEYPIQQLDRYYNCFKELAASHPLSEIRRPEEADMLASSVEIDGQGPEGRVCPDVEEQSSKPVSPGLTEVEELEKYIAMREEMYKKAKEYESKIIGFETAIKRPYFHVRPLDDPELENWHNYLDFIERGDDFNKHVVKLYERCLIACANYPEFWTRYVLLMESSGSMELANNALARATQVFVKKRPEIHLFAARFKELSGDVSGARFEYQILYSEAFPSFLEAIVKHANMEYRQGGKDAAFHVYERAIAAEREKENSKMLAYLLVEFSRFVYLVVGDAEKAREILSGPPEQWQLSRPQLEAIIHLESIQPLPKRVEFLDSLVEKFITPNPENPKLDSMVDREEVSSIFLEFLDLFGDAQSIKKAENRHSLLFLRQKGVLVSKKRYAEDSLVSDKVKMLNPASEQSQSVMGAYPSTQSQWPAGYDQKTPTWPPAPQVQAQWNPGYPLQAGYASYGSYANYATPQMSGSAPQGAAYGAYPPTYPTQSYAQPTAAVAPSFPSQPAPAPQSYYGSYY